MSPNVCLSQKKREFSVRTQPADSHRNWGIVFSSLSLLGYTDNGRQEELNNLNLLMLQYLDFSLFQSP